MKTQLSIILLLLSAIMTACQCDQPTLNDQVQRELTSGKWIIHSVKVGDIDRTLDFADLALLFKNDKNYSASGGQPLLKPEGTWMFSSESGKGRAVIIDPNTFGVFVDILEISNQSLEFSIAVNENTFNETEPRLANGTYVFRLRKQ